MVKRAIIQGLKKLIPKMPTSFGKYHSRYKPNRDSRVRPTNKRMAVGDFFNRRSHCSGHTLLPTAHGPFEMLDTDGTVALRGPVHAVWPARRSMERRATRMTCHAAVRTGGAVGAGWDLH